MAQRIVLATDGSEGAIAASKLLAALPVQPDAAIVALTVLPNRPALPGLTAAHAAALFAATDAAGDVGAERVLDEACRALAPLASSVEPLVRRGHVSSEIVEAAEELAADWLVIGAQGRSNVPAFTLGGVAQEVARQAPCSWPAARGTPRAGCSWPSMDRSTRGPPSAVSSGFRCPPRRKFRCSPSSTPSTRSGVSPCH
jgi:universal stress protein A